MKRTTTINMLGGLLCVIFTLNAAASGSAQSVIDGNAGSGSQGVLMVNMASGDSNLQSNVTAVSVNARGSASVHAHVVQVIDGTHVDVPDVAVTSIAGNAFRNATGAVGINQASGGVNAQANIVAIAVGNNAVIAPDAMLEQSVSGLPQTTLDEHGQKRATNIADTAFSGARGIIQVNQSAGVENATGNNFAMRIHIGGIQ